MTPKQFRSTLRKEAQAINERNRVPGDPHYKGDCSNPSLPSEPDTRMVEKSIPCIQCSGKCVIRRRVEIRTMNACEAEIEVDCPNCRGEGTTTVEVCNACGQQEDECHCLDLEERHREAA